MFKVVHVDNHWIKLADFIALLEYSLRICIYIFSFQDNHDYYLSTVVKVVNIDEHWVELADPSNHDALSNSHRTAVVSIKIQLYLCKAATLKRTEYCFSTGSINT